MQNYDKVVVRRFLVSETGIFLHQRSVGIIVFDKGLSLKACIHKTKSTCVKRNVR